MVDKKENVNAVVTKASVKKTAKATKKTPAKKPAKTMNEALEAITPRDGKKLRALLDSKGSPFPKEKVAEMYGLTIQGAGFKPINIKMEGTKELGKLYAEYNEATGEIVTAALIPSNIDTTYDYLKDADELSQTDLDSVKELELARLLYDNEGICTRSVDALVDNVITGGYISIPRSLDEKKRNDKKDAEAKKICDFWIKYVNNFGPLNLGKKKKAEVGIVGQIGGVDAICEQAALCYNRDGDWVATQGWEQVEVPTVKTKVNLPTRIITHNKATLEFSDVGSLLGMDLIYWVVPEEIKTAIKDTAGGDGENKIINDALSDWMIKEIKGDVTKIPLPPNRTTHIKRRGEDSKKTGTSYLRPFMHNIADKIRLRHLDRATIIGLVQQLTIMMLGSDDKDSIYHEVDPARFRLFKTMLSNLKTTYWMAWGGPDIKKEVVSPDPEILKFSEKYTQVENDLQVDTGMTQLLINGVSSGNTQRDWASFVGVLAKLETFRFLFKAWVDFMLLSIMVENKYEDTFPVYTFKPLQLKDERDMWMTRTTAFQAGVQGREDTLYDLNKDPDSVISKQLDEADKGLNDKIIPPQGSNQLPNRPDNVKDGEGKRRTNTNPRKNTTQAMEASENEFVIPLREAYDQIVDSVKKGIGQKKDEKKIIAYIVAGFGVFMELTNEMVESYYSRLNPGQENRWALETVTWNTGYVQRFSDQVQSTIQGFLGEFKRKEITREILAFKIETYLAGQMYRINLYAEEIPAKVELAVMLDKITKSGVEKVRPRTMGDDKVCGACLAAEDAGTIMTVDEFFALYPLHNNGRCYPEAVTEQDPHQKTLTLVGKENES